MFAAKNCLLTPVGSTVSLGFDQVGTGSTATSFGFTASAGADVFLAYSNDKASVTMSSVQYGGVTMSLVKSVSSALFVYRLAGAGTGASQNFTFTDSGGTDRYAAGFSYLGVHSVSSTTANGTSSPATKSETVSTGQLAVEVMDATQALGALSGTFTISGVTTRFNYLDPTANNLLGVFESASSTTFSAAYTASGTRPWRAIGMVLS